jgi:hypothetical protein
MIMNLTEAELEDVKRFFEFTNAEMDAAGLDGEAEKWDELESEFREAIVILYRSARKYFVPSAE